MGQGWYAAPPPSDFCKSCFLFRIWYTKKIAIVLTERFLRLFGPRVENKFNIYIFLTLGPKSARITNDTIFRGFWGQGIQWDSYFGDQGSTLSSEVILRSFKVIFSQIFGLVPFFGILKKSKLFFLGYICILHVFLKMVQIHQLNLKSISTLVFGKIGFIF